jgi:hypothetical protein
MPSSSVAAVLIVVSAGMLCADVTVRYSMTTAPGEALPASAMQQLTRQMKGLSGATTLQIKGNKARATGMGGTSITDFDKDVITLLDEENKRFATASQKQFLNAMAAQVPKAAAGEQATNGLNLDTTARKTERTLQIQGVNAEETEVVLKAQAPGMPFEMRTVLSVWSAAAGESGRHAALRELEAYSQRAWAGADMITALKSMLGQVPGAGPGMAAFISALKDTGFLLGLKGTISMPGMKEMIRSITPGAAAVPDAGNDVMFTMTQKLEELSTPELPDSLFSAPPDYRAVDLKELIARWLPKGQ